MGLLSWLFGEPEPPPRRRGRAPSRSSSREVERRRARPRARKKTKLFWRVWYDTPPHRRNVANVWSRVDALRRGRAMTGYDPDTGRKVR